MPLMPGSTTSSSIRSGCNWASSSIASAVPAVSCHPDAGWAETWLGQYGLIEPKGLFTRTQPLAMPHSLVLERLEDV